MARGDGCPPGATPVHIVGDETRPGVPDRTVQQWALNLGIIRQKNPALRGILVEDFTPTFELTEALRPTEREVVVDNSNNSLTSIAVGINGRKETVRVIRSLSWELDATPDQIEIQIEGQSGAGIVSAFTMAAGFPADGFLIGSVSSALTAQFNRLLPLSLYPGDKITFKAVRGISAAWATTLESWIEEYPLPLRPAGL